MPEGDPTYTIVVDHRYTGLTSIGAAKMIGAAALVGNHYDKAKVLYIDAQGKDAEVVVE